MHMGMQIFLEFFITSMSSSERSFGWDVIKRILSSPFNLFHIGCRSSAKRDRMFQILSIGVDILSQKHDFHYAVFYQSFNLPDNIFRLSAALPSPHIGHNAVAAEVVAAKHDIDTGFEPDISARTGRSSTILSVSFQISMIVRSDSMCQITDQFCKFVNIVGSENQIHKPVAGFVSSPPPGRLLHHTAAETDHHMWGFAFS